MLLLRLTNMALPYTKEALEKSFELVNHALLLFGAVSSAKAGHWRQELVNDSTGG